jgi:PAS domain S-box-containing protein
VITTDAVERITWLNPVAQRMTGWSPKEAIGTPLTEVFHIVNERTRAPVASPIASCLELQRTVELSDHSLLLSRDGKEFSIEDTAAPIRNEHGELLGAVLVFHDVTRQRQQQMQVERALGEKELLLKEVYHRVKNNLQVVQSLLSIQRRSLGEGPGQSAMDDSIQRVRAMALVHEKLYRSSNLSALSLKDYCADLIMQIAEATGARSRGVQIKLDIAELETGLDSAIPFGLLVSELVGNSLKHGFPEGRGGEVLVKLVRSDSGTGCTLTVTDDGLGIPANQADVFNLGSMGLQLAASLAGQLGGELNLDRSANTLFRAELPRL